MSENEMKEWTACDCDECVEMCERRPCWGTPEEIDQLIQLGYGNRFMCDYWVDTLDCDINIIAPAIVGYEGKAAPFWPQGRCTFLTDDNKCELHDTGFKPKEGRLAICGEAGTPDNLHEEVAMQWDTDEARDLVTRWENQ